MKNKLTCGSLCVSYVHTLRSLHLNIIVKRNPGAHQM